MDDPEQQAKNVIAVPTSFIQIVFPDGPHTTNIQINVQGVDFGQQVLALDTLRRSVDAQYEQLRFLEMQRQQAAPKGIVVPGINPKVRA